MAPSIGDLLVQVGDPTPALGDEPAKGPVLRNSLARDGFPELEGVTTLYQLFQRSVKNHGDKPCLGKRALGADGKAGDYEFDSYQEVDGKVSALGSALSHSGLLPRAKVGVFGINCPEWMISMQVLIYAVLYCTRLNAASLRLAHTLDDLHCSGIYMPCTVRMSQIKVVPSLYFVSSFVFATTQFVLQHTTGIPPRLPC